MNLLETIKKDLFSFAKQKFSEEIPGTVAFDLNCDVERAFGDLSCNIAMVFAKLLKKNPVSLAQQIVQEFHHPSIEKIEIAGPGFINIFLKKELFSRLLTDLLMKKEKFFNETTNQKYNYNIEFVSANPTGPIHVGNGRGGIIGDVLANVLQFLNNNVTREYYINDAGNQIQKLALSFKTRCMQAAGVDIQMPEDSYQGDYLVEMAQKLLQEKGRAILEENEQFFADYAKDKILDYLKNTLAAYGIQYDVWFSEKSLHTSGAIKKSIEHLKKQGYIFEQDGALWFRSTLFGDDKDRVLIKSTGEFTYTAADIAYMQSKIDRGATCMLMTLGHDHHSFAQRLYGLHQALGLTKYPLEIILYQLVKMKQHDALVRMSKRAGNIVTLKDVIDTVGKDVARFFYLHKKPDAQLEFDLDLALKQTEENPVFYIHYAYVRANSIIQKAAETGVLVDAKAAGFIDSQEMPILKKIVGLQDILSIIELHYQPHLLANYTIELAALFHRYYNQNPILSNENNDLKQARLLIIQAFIATMKICLDLMGISAPQKM